MKRIAIKDLKLFLKDRKTMLITFAIPVALITLFAFAFGGINTGEDDREYTLPITDLDQSEYSKEAILRLDTLKSLKIVEMPLEQARQAVRKGNEDGVLILHKGFADSLRDGGRLPVELQYDQAKEMQIGMLQQSLIPTLSMIPFSTGDVKKSMSRRFDKMMAGSSPKIREEVNTQFDSLFNSVSRGIIPENNANSAFDFGSEIKMTKLVMAKDKSSPNLIQAVAGTAVMMLLFSVAGIGMGLLDEKQEGTLKRLLYSPVNPNKILFGKIISANVISIAQLLIMFVFAGIAFGLDIIRHFPGMLIVILATAYACSAFGVFLASFASTRQQVQGLATLIILVMSAIGGSMIPVFIMPVFMQK